MKTTDQILVGIVVKVQNTTVKYEIYAGTYCIASVCDGLCMNNGVVIGPNNPGSGYCMSQNTYCNPQGPVDPCLHQECSSIC